MQTPTASNTIAAWRHCRTDSPLGPIQLACTDVGLCGLWFVEGQKHAPRAERFAAEWQRPDEPVLRSAVQQLAAYFAGRLQNFDVPLDLSAGTPFAQSVWQALTRLAPGQSCSYGQLAQSLGKPLGASRAVGAAVGRNPISIIVPCHRVLGQDGRLTGYAGGLERKKALLTLEGLRWRPGA